eukprot:jgi/Mesvir1/27772/Mv07455-RA.1
MREVITLHVGNFSNFVGAHFWNIQDETLGLQALANESQALEMGADSSNSDSNSNNYASDVDLDVLFRVGEAKHGAPTYNPRMLAIDAKGALGAIQFGSSSGRGASSGTVTTWATPARVFASQPIPPSPFQSALYEEGAAAAALALAEAAAARDPGGAARALGWDADAQAARMEEAAAALEGCVRFWSDYVKAWYHPRSVMELAGVWHGVTPFGDYGDGQEARRCAATRDEISDRIRVFVEECDRVQGFHILADDTSGFGAVSASVLEDIADEYKSTPTLLFGCGSSPTSVAGRGGDASHSYGPGDGSGGSLGGGGSRAMARGQAVIARQLSRALSLSEVAPLVSLYVPLYDVAAAGGPGSSSPWGDFRHLQLNPSSAFHLGALYGVLVDTVTLPTRLRAHRGVASHGPLGACDTATMVQSLTGWGPPRANLASASLSFPSRPVPDPNLAFFGPSSSSIPSLSSSSSPSPSSAAGNNSGGRSLLDGLVDISAPRSDGLGPSLPVGGRDTHDNKGAAGGGHRRHLRSHKGAVFAESFVLRGALGDNTQSHGGVPVTRAGHGGPVSPSSAIEALARMRALGLTTGSSSRRARPVVASYAATCHAVPIPLPFPPIFRAQVGRCGELSASTTGQGMAGSRPGPSAGLAPSLSQGHGSLFVPATSASLLLPGGPSKGVASSPALSRLSSGAHLRPWLRGVAEGFAQLCRPAGPGKAVLADLGYEDGYAGTLAEQLHDLQLAFRGKSEDDFLGSSSDDD